MDHLISIIKKVLTDSHVIFIAIVVFIYMDFVCYVVRYRKKTHRPKIRKIPSVSKETQSASSDEYEEDIGNEDMI